MRVCVRATPFSSPATPPGNSHIVQPRRQPGDGSAEKQREIPTKRTGETTCFFPAHREKPRVWALESHVTDHFTLRTMGGVHTCRLLRNVQQICCSAQTGQHSLLQRSCCPVWALQHILAGLMVSSLCVTTTIYCSNTAPYHLILLNHTHSYILNLTSNSNTCQV